MMATAMATTTKAHDHPPYKEMIVSAIESLKDRKGSSKTAIAKCIASKYKNLPPTHNALLATHLRRLKQNGVIQMIKLSYKLGGLNDDTNPVPKKRGRPTKKLKPDNAVVGPSEKRKPGRPKMVAGEEKRRAGRPKKELAPTDLKAKLKPGRPKKLSSADVAAPGEKRRAGRPRKESAPAVKLILPRNLKAKLKPKPGRPKKSNSAGVAASGEKRKPGRPKKVPGVVENGGGGSKSVEKRTPGRPKKVPGVVENGGGGGSKSVEKRTAGRPKKVSDVVENGGGSKSAEKGKPGRPKKAAKGEGGHLSGTKRRGRPPKEGKPAVAAAKTGPEVKRSVGRPKKNVVA